MVQNYFVYLIRKESAIIYLTFGNNDNVDATLAGAKKGSTTVTFFCGDKKGSCEKKASAYGH